MIKMSQNIKNKKRIYIYIYYLINIGISKHTAKYVNKTLPLLKKQKNQNDKTLP